MNLDFLLQAVKGVVQQHTNAPQQGQGQGGIDTGALLNQIEGLFGQHAAATGQALPSLGNPRPAGDDRYGDPAEQGNGQYGQVKPASEDRYGDPADQGSGRFGRVKPASEDPLGDPADQER